MEGCECSAAVEEGRGRMKERGWLWWNENVHTAPQSRDHCLFLYFFTSIVIIIIYVIVLHPHYIFIFIYRILLAIVIGFAVLALPNQIFFGYLEIGNKFHVFTQEWDILQMSAVILLFHASFNAVLYSIVDEEFRRDVKELFCCCFEKFTLSRDRSSFSTSATGVNSKAYEMTDVNSSV